MFLCMLFTIIRLALLMFIIVGNILILHNAIKTYKAAFETNAFCNESTKRIKDNSFLE